MANRHFGKIADVWKHVALMEAVGRIAPGRYAETHVGSAAYPMVRDSERAFGILRFLEVAAQHPVLAGSRYLAVVAPYVRPGPAGHRRGAAEMYPGSALLAMTALGDGCSHLFCDLDPCSAADLRHRAAGLGFHQWEVAEADGMLTVRAWLDGAGSQSPGPALGPAIVHIDPFEPHARAPGGLSAVEFAGHLATSGIGLVYWYGCDEPGEHAWAYRELCDLTPAPLWCGRQGRAGIPHHHRRHRTRPPAATRADPAHPQRDRPAVHRPDRPARPQPPAPAALVRVEAPPPAPR